MRRVLVSLVLVMAACGGEGDVSGPTVPDAQVPPIDAVAVEIVDVELSSTQVVVRGEAPTPCHDLGSVLRQDGASIEVLVWAEPYDGGEACAQVTAPFEISLGFEAPVRTTPLMVNGELIGHVGA
jgi:hypothetical protein